MSKFCRFCDVTANILFIFLLASIFADKLQAHSPEPPVHPNVILIAIDDMNDWIQLLDKNAPIKTPNLKRLASRGTLFTKAYCSSPACNPSRVSVLTGVRPSNSGVYGNNSDWRRAMPKRRTVMQYFMDHGYRVEGAGKLFHHGREGAFHDDASFHEFQEMPNPPDSPMPKKKLNGLKWFGSPNTDWGRWPQKEADHIDVQTIDFCINKLKLSQKSKQPHFLAVGIFRPHMPFFAPTKYFDAYPLEKVVLPILKHNDLNDIPSGGMKLWNTKRYFWDGMAKADNNRKGTWKEAVQAYQACATFADAQIGRLLDTLDSCPQGKDTIIVLWSDHGYHLGEKEHWEKFALWEKTTHVPYIIVAPNVGKPGSQCKTPVDLMSIFPTLIELCNLKPKKDIDGDSLVLLLKNPIAAWNKPAITTYLRGNHSARSSKWRYIRYADKTEELYDHTKDPNEWNNIANNPEHTNTIARLKKWLPQKDAKQVKNLRKKKR